MTANRKIIRTKDYTILPLGKEIDKGVIETCPRCQLPGKYTKLEVAHVSYRMRLEQWLHVAFWSFLTAEPNVSCTLTTRLEQNEAVDETWGWSTADKYTGGAKP